MDDAVGEVLKISDHRIFCLGHISNIINIELKNLLHVFLFKKLGLIAFNMKGIKRRSLRMIQRVFIIVDFIHVLSIINMGLRVKAISKKKLLTLKLAIFLRGNIYKLLLLC